MMDAAVHSRRFQVLQALRDALKLIEDTARTNSDWEEYDRLKKILNSGGLST